MNFISWTPIKIFEAIPRNKFTVDYPRGLQSSGSMIHFNSFRDKDKITADKAEHSAGGKVANLSVLYVQRET